MVQDGAMIRAYGAINAGRYDAALARLSEAERARPPLDELKAEINYLRGRCFQSSGRLSEAVGSYRYVVDTYPASPFAYQAQEQLKEIAARQAALQAAPPTDAARGGRHEVVVQPEMDLAAYLAMVGSMPATGLDRPPQLRRVARPVYPPALRKQGVEGNAVVFFIVDERGVVVSARVHSASHPAFAQAAIRAVVSWRYAPMTRGGEPTKVGFQQEFPFQLN